MSDLRRSSLASIAPTTSRKRGGTRPKANRRQSIQDYVNVLKEVVSGNTGPKATAIAHSPGFHQEKLYEYLTSSEPKLYPPKTASSDESSEKVSCEGRITVYDVGKGRQPVRHLVGTEGELMINACGPFDPVTTGRLILLHGHQPPNWLSHLGARYEIDFEFWRRHLDYDSLKASPDSFIRRKIPSDFDRMFHLSLVTIGSRHTAEADVTAWYQEDMGDLRRELESFVHEDFQNLIANKSKEAYGKSFMRRLTIHDAKYFSIEQDMSIYVGDVSGGWVVLVWLDIGKDMDRKSLADVLGCEVDDVKRLSTVQHLKSATAPLDAKRALQDLDIAGSKSSPALVTESKQAPLFTFNYGLFLDEDLMAADPFYLLSDVFSYFVACEAEFLEMLQSCLERELEMSTNGKRPVSGKAIRKTLALLHLDYNRRSLVRRIDQLERLHAFVSARADLDWPQRSGGLDADQEAKADKAVRSLERDFAGLLRDARGLSENFSAGMNLLMNSAMTDEGQRAIEQAGRIEKLTALAFFFIPLSYVASVFGMNFKEFQDNQGNKIHIWVWLLVSLGVTALAYCFLSSRARGLREMTLPRLRRRRVTERIAV